VYAFPGQVATLAGHRLLASDAEPACASKGCGALLRAAGVTLTPAVNVSSRLMAEWAPRREMPRTQGGAMASFQDIPIIETQKGARIALGKLYLYPDGHANLTFPAVPEAAFEGANLPLTNAVDVCAELTQLVQRLQNHVVRGRPSS
jgi:hypothetical protein